MPLRAWVITFALAVPAAGQTADPESRFNAGLNHLREGRASLALEEFRRAVDKDGKNPYFQKGLGQAYLAVGKYDQAVDSFRKALELNPYYVDVRNDLGTALILAGKREEGKKEFLAAFNDPTNPTPEVSSRNLGNAYLEEKRYSEAINWFRTSLNRNHTYPDSYLLLADALVGLGKMEEAVATLETAVKYAPENAGVLVALGEGYYRLGRLGEAKTRLEEARRRDPVGPSGRKAGQILQQFPK